MSGSQKRIGRPLVAGKQGKKSAIGSLLNAELKNKLIAEARSNDRSLSQEIELRLERSFDHEWIIQRLREVIDR